MAGDLDVVLHMNGGIGETSYACNSSLQRKVIVKVKPILEESLKRMLRRTNFGRSLEVADLGCSSGPNTLIIISDVVNIVNKTIWDMNQELPTIQIFLNDLFQNDFNSVFKLLPNFYENMQHKNGAKVGACFINATPGNFYGRLFPDNFISFFHSCYSLHWLSQEPKDLTEGSKPLNKGNIYLASTSPPAVYRAYFDQFQRDFKLFLRLRSEELKPGGIMLLSFIGRENDHEITVGEVLGMVLSDMVFEGLIERTKLEYFNIPVYNPTTKEVKQVIEAEGSFNLETMKIMKMGWDTNIEEDIDQVLDTFTRGEFIAMYIRAVFEPLLATEFGHDIMDELFSRFAKKVAKLMETDKLEYTNLVLSMSKDP